MARVAVIDGWRKFMFPVIEHWRANGHEVFTSINWGHKYTWGLKADLVFFFAAENNLRVASHKDDKPAGKRVVAEAVDIDIYQGAFGGVDWSYVDALIFMAEHTKEVGLKKAEKKIPDDLPIHIVPGGVDLSTWTLRRNPLRGYNVAWVGRTWWAKGIFSAIQIFNQLVKVDGGNPWKLYLRADGSWTPLFWKNHVEAYIEANERLHGRIEYVSYQDDLNEWLENIDYHILTSVKEAFSYITAQCAAKGIKPLVQMTNGMDKIWPEEWIFHTHDEAVEMLLGEYAPESYRAFVGDTYPLHKRCKSLDEICGL